MHAIEVLREDHDRIQTLLDKLSASGNDPRLLEILEEEITVHTLAEDNVFLPQVGEAIEESRRTTEEFFEGDAFAGAAEAIAEAHENHRAILSLLAGTRARDGIGDLKRLVERQIAVEESLYPEAEKVLEGEDFERIGDLIEHCKWQVRGLAQAKLASSSSFRPPDRNAVLVEE